MKTNSKLLAGLGLMLVLACTACSNTGASSPNQSTTGPAGNAEANTAGVGARTPNGSTSNPGSQH